MIHDVAVIGLGAMGSAALWQLSKRGAAVLGIDRYSPPHTLGSSHGESRITRQAIGEGRAYVPLVLRSHEIWRELEAETGADLFRQVGFLVVSRPDSTAVHHAATGGFMRATVDAAQAFGIAHELLSPAEAAERFPQFALKPDEVAYYEPGGGYLRPERCVATQLDLARRNGAEVVTGARVTGIAADGDAMRIETDSGDRRARKVIVSAGAGTGALLGAPFGTTLRPIRQVMHWFPIESSHADGWSNGPVYIWSHGDNPEDHFYGFPEIDSRRAIKVADESHGPVIDPDAVDREVPPSDSQRMFDTHLRGRLNGIAPARTDAVTCIYTVTDGSRFLIDEHPADPRILVVSACSGHGFKHSAAIGEAAAERVLTGRSTLDLSPFALP